jgi:hypothetical protein
MTQSGLASVDVLTPRAARAEVAVAVLTAVYVTVAGAFAGLVWSHVAPKLTRSAVVNLSDGLFHPQIGADAWFLLVGVVAGVVCAVVAVVVVGEPGPGVAVGLAAGGVAAAVVADRVGYLMAIAAFRSLGAEPFAGEFDFRVRALGVLVAWPIASLAVVAVAIGIEAARRSLR